MTHIMLKKKLFGWFVDYVRTLGAKLYWKHCDPDVIVQNKNYLAYLFRYLLCDLRNNILFIKWLDYCLEITFARSERIIRFLVISDVTSMQHSTWDISFRKHIIIYHIFASDVYQIWLRTRFTTLYCPKVFSCSDLIGYVFQAAVETFCEYYSLSKITLTLSEKIAE